jgi:hypothetical protein
MKLITLFALFVGALGYRVETVSTNCFLLSTGGCHRSHAEEVATSINKGSVYISHSTIATKYGMYTIIVFMDSP